MFNKIMGATAAIKYAHGTSYSGHVKDDIPHGKGTVSFADGSTVDAEFDEGSITYGKFTCPEFVYEGQFSQRKIGGVGKLRHQGNFTYEGQFKQGEIMKGRVVEKDQKGNIIKQFEGQIEGSKLKQGKLRTRMVENEAKIDKNYAQLQGKFIDGNLHGQGRYTLSNGDVYQGEMYQGIKHGPGTYKAKQFSLECGFSRDEINAQAIVSFANGDKYQGTTKQGKFNGWGKYTYKDGAVYEGDFYCGTMWGQCKIQFPAGSEIQSYEGEVSEGLFSGIGTIFYANGAIYKGYFQDGTKNGFGVYIYGTSKYKCLYVMNRLVGELKLIV